MQLLKLNLFLQAIVFTWISHLQDPYSRRYAKAAASQMFPIWHNLKRRKLKEHTRDKLLSCRTFGLFSPALHDDC